MNPKITWSYFSQSALNIFFTSPDKFGGHIAADKNPESDQPNLVWDFIEPNKKAGY